VLVRDGNAIFTASVEPVTLTVSTLIFQHKLVMEYVWQ